MNFAMITYSLPLLLLCMAMLAICVIQFIRIRKLRQQVHISSLINSASIGGYYLWQKKDSSEYVSPHLASMLGMHKGNDLESVAGYFHESKKDLLQKSHNLKNGQGTTFHFTGKAELQGITKEFQCIGCQVIDEKYNDVSAVIIWFF